MRGRIIFSFIIIYALITRYNRIITAVREKNNSADQFKIRGLNRCEPDRPETGESVLVDGCLPNNNDDENEKMVHHSLHHVYIIIIYRTRNITAAAVRWRANGKRCVIINITKIFSRADMSRIQSG